MVSVIEGHDEGAAWLVEGMIPMGSIVGIADVDDGTPAEILAHGYDVVIHLGEREISGQPVLLTVVWRDGLLPGHTAPEPFWVRFVPGCSYIRCEAPA